VCRPSKRREGGVEIESSSRVLKPALALFAVTSTALAAPIPPPPAGERSVYDAASLLSVSDLALIEALQDESLNRYNSPIVVVTIDSVATYGATSVEALATRWFNTWDIGTLGLQRGANQGILLLVSVRDRRARIELGADWGHDWDDHAARIMSGTIVPRFKAGDYSGGIADGVSALALMAKKGPRSHPPGDFAGRFRKYSILDPTPFLAAVAVGIGLIVLGMVVGGSARKWLVLAGIAVLVFAFFSYVVIAVLFILVSAFGRRRGGFGGSSGRGFSGGSSGGGGASGSW
jgi:uncharacterized protein